MNNSIIRNNKVLALFLFLTVSTFLHAQVLDPVDWRFKQKKISNTEVDLVFTATIDNKWHLYSQHLPDGGPIPTSFTFVESGRFELLGDVVENTKPEVKYDASFNMDLTMFSNKAEFRQRIKVFAEDPFIITGSIEYMSCDDERCLPPTDEEFSFTIAGLMTAVTDTLQESGLRMADKTFEIGEAHDTLVTADIPGAAPAGTTTGGRSIWLFFLISFVAGLAAILTPCVFPMIPMTVTFFMRGSEHRAKAIIKGLIFGISIILIYTSIGFLVSLTSIGADFANQVSSHWIPNLIFFILFMVFAASFLGMFELVLPGRWVNSADKKADKGGYLGAFFMAFTLVLVSFSCTGPIVGALLVESTGGLAIRPVVGMFGFSLAFALPFTLLSIFPSWLSNLPKSGGWLNAVKIVLGFLVLAFGFKFLSTIDQTYHLNILSREVYLSIWIVIFTLLGFYFLGKLKFAHDSEVLHISFPRLILAIASFSFVIYMVPGLLGAPLAGISAMIPPKTAQSFDLLVSRSQGSNGGEYSTDITAGNCGAAKYTDFLHLPHGLKGYFDLEEGLACAKSLNKPVFLDFKGHSCSNCKEMEARVWSNPEVLKRLREDFIIIALYTDDKTKLPEEEWITSSVDGKVKKAIGRKNMDFQIAHYNTNTEPYYVLVDHDLRPLTEPKGYDLNIQRFVDFLDEGIGNFKK